MIFCGQPFYRGSKHTMTKIFLPSLLIALFVGSAWGQTGPTPPSNLRAVVDGIAPSSVASQDPSGIFDGNGGFDGNAYVSAAKAYGTAAMIAERFGNPWTSYHPQISAPTWTQARSVKYVNPANQVEWWYY